MEAKEFFQFERIINVLVSSFRFIWIPMLWVYSHYILFIFFSAVAIYRRQILSSIDIRFWRLKTVPALKGLSNFRNLKFFGHSLWPQGHEVGYFRMFNYTFGSCFRCRCDRVINLWAQIQQVLIFILQKLWLDTATHNFKWVKLTNVPECKP